MLKKVEQSRQSAIHALKEVKKLKHADLYARAIRDDQSNFPLEAKIAMETPPGTYAELGAES